MNKSQKVLAIIALMIWWAALVWIVLDLVAQYVGRGYAWIAGLVLIASALAGLQSLRPARKSQRNTL